MVKLLVGHKGSGKTKQMIDIANHLQAQYKRALKTDGWEPSRGTTRKLRWTAGARGTLYFNLC